ncbi:MAG: PAS domain S-box protein [Deltaproteobacteria bacterium]|nr:PAS domain S-box protein [Deltaproteobacteria bacterium]
MDQQIIHPSRWLWIWVWLISATALTAYQLLKWLVYPGMTLIHSNIITIIVGSFVATTAAYLITRKFMILTDQLSREIVSRRQAEQKLQEQNLILDNVVKDMPYPFFIINAHDYTIRLTNMPLRNDLTEPATCYSISHQRNSPCEGDEHPCPLVKVKKTGKPIMVEHLHHDHLGVLGSYEVHARPVFDADGNVVEIIEYFLNVTRRALIEEQLRESEEKYRTLVERMNDGLGIQDAAGIITYVNARMCEMLGYSKRELLGRQVPDLLDEEGQKIWRDLIVKRKRGGRASYEVAWIKKSGERVTTVISPEIITDKNGKYKGSFAVITDITARKAAEELLRKSEHRYRQVVENSNDAIVVTQDGVIKFFNRRTIELTGYSGGKYLLKPFIDYIHPEDREKVIERYIRRLSGRSMTEPFKFRIIDAHGAEKSVEGTSVLIDWDGKTATLSFLCDISDRLKAEAEQHRHIKLQGVLEMAGAVCHEMNQPMQVILGYSEMLLEEIPDKETLVEELVTIRQEIKRMAGITSKLEKITKYEPVSYPGGKQIIDISKSTGQ